MLSFSRSADGKEGDCSLTVRLGYSVIPEDMLYESIETSFVMPTVVNAETPDEVGMLTDVFFSDSERVPHSPAERAFLCHSLEIAKDRIRDEFRPTPPQQRAVDEKLDYLASKVIELDKFNWKRLLASTLVGISVDLCFGTFVPVTLLKLFLELFTQKLLDKDGTQRVGGGALPEGARTT
jgi:hypothetical protein